MTIGVIAAMGLEVNKLQALMEKPVTEVVGGITFVRGTIDGQDIVTAVCGVGKVAAAMCTQTMILEYKPDFIVNIGIAGTLVKHLKIMGVVIADSVCQHDMDTSALGDPVGFISGADVIFIPTDNAITEKLISSAHKCRMQCASGVIASGDQFIENAEQKNRIHELFGAVAVEMEGASIGQVCYMNRVPFAVLRTISDGEGAAMDYDAFGPAAAHNSIRVLKRFIAELGKE